MVCSASTRSATRRLSRATALRPRLFYRPPPWAVSFACDASPRVAVVAANRVGKSTTAIRRMARLAADTPGMRFRIVAPTSKVSNTSHAPILFEALRDLLADGCNYRLGRGFNDGNVCKLKNGSWIQLLNYKQDPQAHASVSLHGVILDEPPPYAFFREAEKRVFDTGGFVWVTMTAVDRPIAWLKKVVQNGVELGLWSFYQVALSHENCPWYTPEQIEAEKARARLAPWSYAQTIEGAWDGVTVGRWFSGFESQRNATVHEPANGWPWPGEDIHLSLSVDHGEAAGHTHWILFGYQYKRVRGRLYVAIRALCEWTNERRMGEEEEARSVRAALDEVGVTLDMIGWAVGDTNSAGKSSTARSMNEVFEQEFARLEGRHVNMPRLLFRPARKGADSVTGGVARCNQLFASVVDGVTCLSVHVSCEHLMETLSHWAGKDDALKHAGDAFRYGISEILRECGWEDSGLSAAA